jgi:hypothetical protein
MEGVSHLRMPSEHGCDAGNLFLVVHHEVSRHVRLEVKGHLPTHPEKTEINIEKKCSRAMMYHGNNKGLHSLRITRTKQTRGFSTL